MKLIACSTIAGPAALGLPGIEWRLGIVLDGQLGQLGRIFSAQPGEHYQSEIDSRGNSASCNAVSIDDYARIDRLRAECAKTLARGPMRGRLVAFE